jgi:hypothetical protein
MRLHPVAPEAVARATLALDTRLLNEEVTTMVFVCLIRQAVAALSFSESCQGTTPYLDFQ